MGPAYEFVTATQVKCHVVLCIIFLCLNIFTTQHVVLMPHAAPEDTMSATLRPDTPSDDSESSVDAHLGSAGAYTGYHPYVLRRITTVGLLKPHIVV